MLTPNEELRRLRAERDALWKAVDYAARTLRGDGTDDQGEAYDRTLRILDAALAGKQ